MTLGAFLLLIFVLWLVDKHHLWHKALKVFAVLIVLVVAGAVVLWVHNSRVEKQEETEQEAAKEAARVQQRTQLGDCIKRLTVAPEDGNTLQIDAKSTCEDNPNAATMDGPRWYKMRASDGKWYKTLAFSAEDARSKMEKAPPRKKISSPRIHHLLATDEIDLYTSEFGSLICAHVAKSESVILLEDDSSWVRVKTQSGKSGWARSSAFEMTD